MAFCLIKAAKYKGLCRNMEKKFRLRTNIDFNETYKHGKNYWNKYLVIYVYKVPKRKEYTRVGYTITKKIGNAVVRNQIRRRMKEIMRLHFPNIKEGYDIIFIPKKNIVNISYDQLENSTIHILKLANIYEGE